MTCACREPEIRCAECGDTYRRARQVGHRRELLRDAAIEAARQFMAANLRAEVAGERQDEDDPRTWEAYQAATQRTLDALQDLRDALAAERRSR